MTLRIIITLKSEVRFLEMIYSKQREMLREALSIKGYHPTAEALYSKLKPDNPQLSLATVYRNLNQLERIGLAARVKVPGAADRFDSVCDGHHHMRCVCCGSITDIDKDALGDICGLAGKSCGCKITSYDVLFHGFCRQCAGQE